ERGGRPRHPRSGHDDVRSAHRRDPRGEVAHRPSLRREPARRPGRHRPAHRSPDPRARAGGELRPGAGRADPETASCRRRPGVAPMRAVGAPRHAEKVAAWGVDAVIAQGAEGGGHTGTIPTSLLLPQVVDAVDVPVLAAGGFTDGRGLTAALAWGAAGVAMGT